MGEKVFLKVSPWKKIMRFGRKGKLSPRFIGPYEMIEKVGPMAYIPSEIIELRSDLTCEGEPVEILVQEVKELRNR